MDGVLNLQRHIEAYLGGTLALPALHDWLGQTAATIDCSGDERARQLAARTWRILSEYGAGHRDEASVRLELQRLLPAERVSR